MSQILFPPEYLKKIVIEPNREKFKQAIENHRLISIIDDDGNIDGSALAFNHKYSS
jgi:hypothetical protein